MRKGTIFTEGVTVLGCNLGLRKLYILDLASSKQNIRSLSTSLKLLQKIVQASHNISDIS